MRFLSLTEPRSRKFHIHARARGPAAVHTEQNETEREEEKRVTRWKRETLDRGKEFARGMDAY